MHVCGLLFIIELLHNRESARSSAPRHRSGTDVGIFCDLKRHKVQASLARPVYVRLDRDWSRPARWRRQLQPARALPATMMMTLTGIFSIRYWWGTTTIASQERVAMLGRTAVLITTCMARIPSGSASSPLSPVVHLPHRAAPKVYDCPKLALQHRTMHCPQ